VEEEDPLFVTNAVDEFVGVREKFRLQRLFRGIIYLSVVDDIQDFGISLSKNFCVMNVKWLF